MEERNPVRIERVDRRIRVESGFRDKDLISSVPGATWDRQERQWYTRLSWTACIQLRGIFGGRIEIGPELLKWSTEQYEKWVYPCMELREMEDWPWREDDNLYPRQKVGVEFLVRAQYALMGDEVGAGKTRQIIKALEARDAYPAIVVCPNGVQDSWIEEFEKVAPHRKIVKVQGAKKLRLERLASQSDVYVIHWDLLREHSRLAPYGYIKLSDKEKQPKELNAIPYKSVIGDESHRMQDPKSKRTRAMWYLGDAVPEDGMRILATGTPVTNHLGSLWPQMRFVMPDEYPQKTKWIDRYALQLYSPFGFTEIAGVLPEHREEFFKQLDPRFIRRPTKVVVPELPDPIRLPPRKVELKGAQAKAYKQMRDELLVDLGDGTLMAKNPLTQMTRLRQLAAASGELDMSQDPPKMMLREPSVVIDDLIEVLAELEGKQTLWFSESRQLMELASARAHKEGIDHGLITGAVTDSDRTARRHAFQEGTLQHLGLTMGAGGEGLTLTAADAMIFIERSFSLLKNVQAEGRAVRPGQMTRVLIIDIVPTLGVTTKGEEIRTIYGHVDDIVRAKQEMAEEVTRDQELLRRFLSK